MIQLLIDNKIFAVGSLVHCWVQEHTQWEDVTLPHIIRSNPAGFSGLRRTPTESGINFLAEWLTETFIPGNANSGLNMTGSPVSDRTEFHRNHLKTGGSGRVFFEAYISYEK